jgi:hypothetical protein
VTRQTEGHGDCESAVRYGEAPGVESQMDGRKPTIDTETHGNARHRYADRCGTWGWDYCDILIYIDIGADGHRIPEWLYCRQQSRVEQKQREGESRNSNQRWGSYINRRDQSLQRRSPDSSYCRYTGTDRTDHPPTQIAMSMSMSTSMPMPTSK